MANTPSLGLSDEEFLKQDPSLFLEEDNSEPENNEDSLNKDSPEEGDNEEEDSSDDISLEDDSEDSEAQEDTTDPEDEEEVSQPDGDTQTEHEPFSVEGEEESLDTSKKDSQDTQKDTSDTTEFDYKSAYEEVTKPFKANGVEMKVEKPEDIVKLMQMGANYQKKMAQLKPNLKIVKMLEKHQLLDEKKLNNLIDLSKKDPKAVAQLIKESGIDPLDVDTEGTDEYKPNNYTISDSEYDIDNVLDSIKNTSTFQRTISTITQEWDDKSRSTISHNPEIISIINEHMQNGVFDKVNSELQKEKSLGRLRGFSDVDAYQYVATQLAQKGVLAQANNTDNQNPDASEETSSPQKATKRKEKRKAAAVSKSSRKSTKKAEPDYLGLSDAEFLASFEGR